MSRYLMLLGIVIVVFCVVVGSIELSSSYREYQTHIQAGGGEGNPMTVMDVVKWQVARLVGAAVIAGGLISGSMLMGLGWIGKTLEEVRDALEGELASTSAGNTEGPVRAGN
ncbi:MAG: hypothetical protein LAO23_11940 [Acidobacteriia bacterium]|nr:hypothetical protein [Terriglobia bacterium]